MATRKKGMGSHQSAKMKNDEWLTPPEILYALGKFDLDPCAPVQRPWPTAEKHFTVEDDGLRQIWDGRVWCNPPYGELTGPWLNRCAQHDNAIALIFARTETKIFHEHVWKKADSIFFFYGRLWFYHVDGSIAKSNAGAPSCLVAYGTNNVASIYLSGLKGKHIVL